MTDTTTGPDPRAVVAHQLAAAAQDIKRVRDKGQASVDVSNALTHLHAAINALSKILDE